MRHVTALPCMTSTNCGNKMMEIENRNLNDYKLFYGSSDCHKRYRLH